jgi:AraC-like DNA-binding protein
MVRDEIETVLGAKSERLDGLHGQAWVKDDGSRFLAANREFADDVGARPSEVVGSRDLDFFPRSRVVGFRGSDRAALASGRAILVVERDAHGRVFETMKVPLRSASGAAVATLGASWNVGFLERLRDLCEARPEPRGRFLAECDGDARSGRVPACLVEFARRLWANGGLRVLPYDSARAIGVHPDTLGRAFRRRIGATPSTCRGWLRIRAARDALIRGDQSLAAVAQMCGFFDQSHLTREMRRHLGLTPNRLRKMAIGSCGLEGPRAAVSPRVDEP